MASYMLICGYLLLVAYYLDAAAAAAATALRLDLLVVAGTELSRFWAVAAARMDLNEAASLLDRSTAFRRAVSSATLAASSSFFAEDILVHERVAALASSTCFFRPDA